MKAWNNDWRPDRWVKQIHKHRMPYLRAYAPPRPEAYEGKVGTVLFLYDSGSRGGCLCAFVFMFCSQFA